jgi:hypothetical protein
MLSAQRDPFALFDWMERLAPEHQETQYKQITSSTESRNSMLKKKVYSTDKTSQASEACILLAASEPPDEGDESDEGDEGAEGDGPIDADFADECLLDIESADPSLVR